MTIKRIEGGYTVCKLEQDSVPERMAGFTSLTRTKGELSLVCEENCVPINAIRCERGWALYMLEGPFDFSQTGVLASAIDPLADAKIPIFAVSTYETDYIMVKRTDAEDAEQVWIGSGFTIT